RVKARQRRRQALETHAVQAPASIMFGIRCTNVIHVIVQVPAQLTDPIRLLIGEVVTLAGVAREIKQDEGLDTVGAGQWLETDQLVITDSDRDVSIRVGVPIEVEASKDARQFLGSHFMQDRAEAHSVDVIGKYAAIPGEVCNGG